MAKGDYYQVRESFMAHLNGAAVLYTAGEVVDDSDPAFRKSPELFMPLVVRGAVEQATAAPGEKRTTRFGRRTAKAEKPIEPVKAEPEGKPVSLGGMKGRT